MAGAGVRVFQPGEVLTAALVNTYLQDQVVCRFDDVADRDGAFGGVGQPVLEEGRICYLDSTNELQYFDGTIWVTISPEAITGVITTKGDLVAGTAPNTVARLPAGADGRVLTANSATATGLSWEISSVPDNAITTAKLNNGAVTTEKIANDSITSDKIAPGTVIAADIAAGTITATELADGAVTSGKILDGTIVNADINASAGIVDTKLATISTADKVSISALNIDGGTDIGSAIADADLIIVDNGGAGTNRKAAATRISDYVFGKVSGDVLIASNGAATIQANSVALGTDTTGNYVASLVAGTGITITNNSGEGATPTIAVTGSTYQPLDAELTALAGTTSAADALPYFTGSGTATTTTLTSAARQVLDDTSLGAIRTTLGVGTADSPAFAGATIDAVQVGITAANEIDTTSGNLILDSAGGTVTVDDNVTVTGVVTTRAASTQDAVVLQGRAGGTSSRSVTITPASLSASRTLTLPDTTGTVITTGDSGTVTSTMIADVTIDTKTANYTLALTDKNKFIEMNLSSANTVSVPTNGSVAFPVGSQIHITQYGTGKTQIVAVTPATTTIRSTPGTYLRAQYSSATLIKRATDEWYLVGDLSAT